MKVSIHQGCQFQHNSNSSFPIPGDSIPIPILIDKKNLFQFQFLRISRQEWQLLSDIRKSNLTFIMDFIFFSNQNLFKFFIIDAIIEIFFVSFK